jgi:hypothetical protein
MRVAAERSPGNLRPFPALFSRMREERNGECASIVRSMRARGAWGDSRHARGVCDFVLSPFFFFFSVCGTGKGQGQVRSTWVSAARVLRIRWQPSTG